MKGGVKRFAYKNDTADLIQLCQMFRDVLPSSYTVHREHFIFFDSKTKYLGYNDFIADNNTFKFRNPDVLILDDDNDILFCHELDGEIHVINLDETDERNLDYKKAEIPLLITVQDSKKSNDFIKEAYNTMMVYLFGEPL